MLIHWLFVKSKYKHASLFFTIPRRCFIDINKLQLNYIVVSVTFIKYENFLVAMSNFVLITSNFLEGASMTVEISLSRSGKLLVAGRHRFLGFSSNIKHRGWRIDSVGGWKYSRTLVKSSLFLGTYSLTVRQWTFHE